MKIFTGSAILISTVLVNILPANALSQSNILQAVTFSTSPVTQENIFLQKTITTPVKQITSSEPSTSSTNVSTPEKNLISKQDTPTTEIKAADFSNYKSIVKKYSPEQKKKLLNILNSKEAKEVKSIEQLGKIIGDDDLKAAIQKDLSISSQTSRINWWKIIKLLIEILILLLDKP